MIIITKRSPGTDFDARDRAVLQDILVRVLTKKRVVPSWVVFTGVVNLKIMHHASIVIKEEYVSISAKERCIALPIHRIRIYSLKWNLVETRYFGEIEVW